ncbi:MAG: OpgC domain-containing protein [Beijerinckiaceae bacterium]|jgi:hypothetical protein|nr:OpgC domain-containing protein [Beijerinckiaceae bacterium]
MSAMPTLKPDRDRRIDLFRGIALVMIFINHMPATPWSLFTSRAWGFSDAAEVFVLLAGLAAALAYHRYFAEGTTSVGLATVFARVWKLYRTHLFLFLMVGTLCVIGAERFNETSHLEALGFDTFLQNPAAFLGHVVTLRFLPGYLDILPLYVLLLAMVPVLFLLHRLHWTAPLVVSAALWIAVQTLGFNIPNSRTAREWTFNPFAWQLLFTIGFVIGLRMRHGLGLGLLGRPLVARSITILAALFTAAAFLISAPWREIPGYENVWLVDPLRIGAISKTDLSIIRLVDVLAKFWLVMVLIRPDAAWLGTAPARATALMGKHSLEVFALGTIGSIAGGIIIIVNGYHPAVIAAAVIVGTALMLVMGAFMEWRSGALAPARKAKAEAPVPSETPMAPTPERRVEPASSRSTLLALDPRV